ncbi:MAG: serine phosphatase [Candidatus Angelobacter sp.]|nr:serine phosphatase [Candidatus Angelobacter sp.]
MLARLTWYVGLIWIGIHLAQGMLLVFAKSTSESLDGWAAAFNFLFGLFLTLVIFRWMRRTLLWKLRNRLIITYIFIGVIPVLLVLAMAGLAAELFGNQYATSQALTEIESQVRNLELVNSSITSSRATATSRLHRNAPEDLIPENMDALEKRYPGLQIQIFRQGKMLASKGPEPRVQGLDLPAWLVNAGAFQGIVVEDDGKHYLRSLQQAKVGNQEYMVLFSVPVTKELLDIAMDKIGEVSFDVMHRDNVPSASKGHMYRDRTGEVLTGGTVPAAPRWSYDPISTYGTDAHYKLWASGEEIMELVRVKTRPSVLFGRLFSSRGQYAGAALIVMVAVAIVFALIELVALFFGIGLTRTITSSVANLYRATQHINSGDLKYRINVKSTDQLASLQTAFNSMSANLEKLIEEQKEKERLESELAIAQEVQATLFPRESVNVKSLELHGVCRPARTVSGDYYDFLPCGDEQLGIALGDISGKGISAALLMATIHSAVRAYEYGRMPVKAEFVHAGVAAIGGAELVSEGRDLGVYNNGMQSPAVVLELLNRHLFQSTQSEKYATLFLGVYDGNHRSLTYTNAGHLPPLIVEQDGTVHRLETGGTVIGLFDGMTYEQATVKLRTHDIFVAFSDGITEPENEFGEFGEERLIEIVRANRRLPLPKISELVIAAVQDWIGADAEQPDDVTLVLARVQ